MVYSETLAERIRKALEKNLKIQEKKMFGGIVFMINGHMALGIVKDDLMVRIGKMNWEDAMTHPFVEEMDFTGKVMKSMIYVDEEGLLDENYMRYWIQRGIDFALALPPK